jgi:hypothetical protein
MKDNYDLLIPNKSFENATKSKCLEVKNKNCIHEEIKSRMNFSNACYHSAQNLLTLSLLSKNFMLEYKKIKSRMNLGNACYHSVQNLLTLNLLSNNFIRIYITIILSVVLYRCEIWSLILREDHR